MKQVREHFRKLTSVLTSRAAQAGTVDHAVTVGTLREIIAKDFLRPILPRHFEIMSGKVIDSTGQKSSQQDCMIVDQRMPFIDVGSSDTAVVIAESVAATVQIKSFLNKGELLSALQAAETTKSLKRLGTLEYSKGPATVQAPLPFPILSYIFAFDGNSPDTIASHVNDFAHGALDGKSHDGRMIVDGICILNKGLILNSPQNVIISGSTGILPNLGESTLAWFAMSDDALFGFTRRLISDLVYLRLRNFDLDAYFACPEIDAVTNPATHSPVSAPANDSGNVT
jgi:hypothetical protein